MVSDEIRLGNGLPVSRIPRYASRFANKTINRCNIFLFLINNYQNNTLQKYIN